MLRRRLIIIGGKGGVGRTTSAAALALALARRGRRTLLAHVRCERCERQLANLLGADRVDEEIRQVQPNLWAVNMNPRAAIREMGLMVLRFRTVYRAVLENNIVRSFLRALPALDDYSMIGKAWYHTTELDRSGLPRFQTVIFDGPATGHLISMLRIPQVILDSVPEGPLTADARKARTLLSDPEETAMLLVTLAEEMPTSEALDLYRAATQELEIHCERLVINQLYPDELLREPALASELERLAARVELEGAAQGGPRDALGGRYIREPEDASAESLATMVEAARTMGRRATVNRQYLQRLTQEVPVPQLRLPYVFAPELDLAALEPLVQAFDGLLGEAA